MCPSPLIVRQINMITRTKINQWLLEGEGPLLDFKQNITSAPKIARAIVAFANSRGGTFLVGVGDKGHIIGVDAGGEMYELEKAASKFCSPPIPLEFEEFEINSKTLLIAQVAESNQKPHYAIDKNGDKQIFVRIADKCVIAPPLITNTLLNGDLNGLKRSNHYQHRKKELQQYLKQNKTISCAQYAKLWHTSERSALRTLLDFMFEGAIQLQEDNLFTL